MLLADDPLSFLQGIHNLVELEFEVDCTRFEPLIHRGFVHESLQGPLGSFLSILGDGRSDSVQRVTKLVANSDFVGMTVSPDLFLEHIAEPNGHEVLLERRFDFLQLRVVVINCKLDESSCFDNSHPVLHLFGILADGPGFIVLLSPVLSDQVPPEELKDAFL